MRGMKCLACWLICAAALALPFALGASAGDGGEGPSEAGSARVAESSSVEEPLALEDLEALERQYEELGALWEERAREYALRFEEMNRELTQSLAAIGSLEPGQEPDPDEIRRRMEALEGRWEAFGERFEELGERWAERGEELGERLAEWGEEYGERWEEQGETWSEHGEAWAEHWAEWGEQFAERWAEFGEDQAEQWEQFGEQIGEAFEDVDWDALAADLEGMAEDLSESLEDVDWEGLGDWIANVVEDAVSTALEAAEQAHGHDGR